MRSGLKKKVNGEFVDIGGEPNKFRGVWTPDEEFAYYDFSSLSLPVGMVTTTSTNGKTQFDAEVAPGGAVAIRLIPGRIQSGEHATLETSPINLGLKGVTRVQFYARYVKGGSYPEYGRFQFNINASTLVTVDPSDPPDPSWVLYDFPVSDQQILQWIGLARANIGNNDFTSGAQVSGITFFGSSDAYMRGDFVTYDGQMWRSLIDNNAETPGLGLAWEKTLTLPLPKGTTEERPSASLVGSGYCYYDTTLGYPIWSNGTDWTNSSGVTV